MYFKHRTSSVLPVSQAKMAPDVSNVITEQCLAGSLGILLHSVLAKRHRSRQSLNSTAAETVDAGSLIVGGLLPRCQ